MKVRDILDLGLTIEANWTGANVVLVDIDRTFPGAIVWKATIVTEQGETKELWLVESRWITVEEIER